MSDATHTPSAIPDGADERDHLRGRETVAELLAAAAASFDADRDAAKACIQRAVELLRRGRSGYSKPAQGSTAPRGGLALWQKQRLVAYVAANLGWHIRASDLAHVVGLSTGHFFRAFRESFGEPPLAYVAKQRIRRCQELMLNSNAGLSGIAQDCGMCDQPHLTRVFRRIVGVNPGVWRRQFGQQGASKDVADERDRGPLCSGGRSEHSFP